MAPQSVLPLAAVATATTEIVFSKKKAASIPPQIWAPASSNGFFCCLLCFDTLAIVTIDISYNQLPSLPMEVFLCASSLKTLNASFNKIASVPAEVCLLPSLQFLDLRSNLLQSLPADMRELGSLQEIALSMNRFSTIPPVLYSIQSLTTLVISDNQLSSLDAHALSQLPKLRCLDVSNNSISSVFTEHISLSSSLFWFFLTSRFLQSLGSCH